MAKLKKKISEIVYDFPYGESHAHTVVAASDIDHLDDKKPGLYAWYIRVLPNETAASDLKFYGNLFGSKRYSVDVWAHLGEDYQGALTLYPAFDPAMPANIDLISTITTVFSPPIYVGVAKNVRSRLKSHMGKLMDALTSPPVPPPALPLPVPGSPRPNGPATDTDDESGYFGGRIGDLLRAHNMIDIRHLFVKIVFQPVNDQNQRRAVEHFANRVFFPFCGRK